MTHKDLKTKTIKLTRNEFMVLQGLGYTESGEFGLHGMNLNEGKTTYGNGGYGMILSEDYSADVIDFVKGIVKENLVKQAKLIMEIADKI